jgi:phage-related protein
MAQKQKIPLSFYRTPSRVEPVREFIKRLPTEDRKALGSDLLAAQWKWPVGMPLCRPMGGGLYEIRTTLPSRRIVRTILIYWQKQLVALHAFIKKTTTTPDDDLKIARKRQKETEHEKEE